MKKIVLLSSILAGSGYVQVTSAHSAGGPIDFGGNNANATDLAAVQCFDDGNGPAERLSVQIEDTSPPEAGLLVSMQVLKNNKMTNVTDPVSGDGVASPKVSLNAGNGSYLISVNKTKAGTRQINATYHCEAAGDVHTGTDITLYQAQ